VKRIQEQQQHQPKATHANLPRKRKSDPEHQHTHAAVESKRGKVLDAAIVENTTVDTERSDVEFVALVASYKLAKIQSELAVRGLDIKGRKNILAPRLVRALRAEAVAKREKVSASTSSFKNLGASFGEIIPEQNLAVKHFTTECHGPSLRENGLVVGHSAASSRPSPVIAITDTTLQGSDVSSVIVRVEADMDTEMAHLELSPRSLATTADSTMGSCNNVAPTLPDKANAASTIVQKLSRSPMKLLQSTLKIFSPSRSIPTKPTSIAPTSKVNQVVLVTNSNKAYVEIVCIQDENNAFTPTVMENIRQENDVSIIATDISVKSTSGSKLVEPATSKSSGDSYMSVDPLPTSTDCTTASVLISSSMDRIKDAQQRAAHRVEQRMARMANLSNQVRRVAGTTE
jgi:hypothetical protein